MAVNITQRYVVTLDNSKEWLVPQEAVKIVDGTTFLKFCPKYARYVKANIFKAADLDLRKSKGYKLLLELRAKASEADEAVPKAAGLFDDIPTPSATKKRRVNRDEQQAVRDSLVSITVPGFEVPIQVYKNAHPTDGLVIPFDKETLETVFKFIEQSGETEVDESVDEKPIPDGAIKMGLGRMARRVNDEDTGKSRLKYIKELE
jgi:hypothetical protein